MRRLYAVLLALLLAGSALAQSSGGGAVSNSPALIGARWTTAPAACTVGQIGFKTNATAGKNIYGCTSANTWTLQGDGSTVAIGDTISGGTAGRVVYVGSGPVWAQSANLTFDGTTLTTTGFTLSSGVASFPVGSAGAPPIFFAGSATTGFYARAANYITISKSGVDKYEFHPNGLAIASDQGVQWTSASGHDAPDVGFSRIAAGTLALGNGNVNDFTGTLKLTLLNIASGGSTTISTGVGSVRMSTANAATNTSWIPIQYAGTTYYVPGWTTNAP